ncbi:amidohydrolase [Rhodococcus wratislaviensis]|uniref:Peptidase M20 domain-containing protein 2 n=1 Tax=Rhodococcus wratislaviensis TaxID=44752 RepID=A0AB38FP62_RHOWR|nr:amidohydrolase [Rhodococcus wratislaviensis]REE71331.1 amidohydrolase [Rhodococcus wratislaviensis]SPZ43341.1 metal dependent amidohydrolase [Rhodococcus wratislaviensis]
MTLATSAGDTTDSRTGALKDTAAQVLRNHEDELLGLSHRIHGTPEIAFEEHQAAALVGDALRRAGFDTTVGVYGLDTAVEAIYGSGDLTVAICAEYDALPEVGHACGHNMIAAAGVGAALALAAVADEAGLRVKLLGTPAEEHGGGKIPMLEAGAWDDAALSLMVHGASGTDMPCASLWMQAVDRFEVTFTGRAAHAAGAPEHGINAGAAATIALNAIGLVRQQFRAKTRVNAFVSHGGEVTNIIPARTVVQVEVRAPEIEEWREVKTRVLACFEAGALATGCEWTYTTTEPPYAPMIQNPLLADIWDRNLQATGRELTSASLGGGSSDMGNVSQVVPSIHPTVAVLGSTAIPHNSDFADAAASPAADAAVLDGATALAWTVLDIALDAEVRGELLRLQAERPKGSTRIATWA